MSLTQQQFADSLQTLFNPEINPNDPAALAECAAAYQNLVMHFIEKNNPELLGHVAFDPVRMNQMLRRFNRDAFGVGHFDSFLDEAVVSETISKAAADAIKGRLCGLSIRINSTSPRKTRIAAAFALWSSTMRPLCVLAMPSHPSPRLQRLQATITFWISTLYLEMWGEVQIGIPDNLEDLKIRLRRIWYDFTFRDLNLSSLEMMYASIFRPRKKQ